MTDGLASALPVIGDTPLCEPLEVSAGDYQRLMLRIGIAEGGPGTSVSAFSSSI